MATLTFNPNFNNTQNLLSLEALEAILVPGGQERAHLLNRRSLVDFLSSESPTIDSKHSLQIFRDFGDSRVAVNLDRYTRTVRVHWMNAGPNFSMNTVVWDYSLDRPQGVLNPVLSYQGL